MKTHTIELFLSGPIEVAKQVIRRHVMLHPKCVTVTPTTVIYTGGEEQGYVVGLRAYPRFPETPESLDEYAVNLANALLDETHQMSAMIVGPERTEWITRRSEK